MIQNHHKRPGASRTKSHVRYRRCSIQPVIRTAVDENKKVAEESSLLHWDELPAWRRDNNFIRYAYRHTRPSYQHSFRSLFYLHNQSVNIWSHLIGTIVAVIFSVYLYFIVYPRYETATVYDVYAFACLSGGATLCLGASATFHTLLDHSPEVARLGNKMDYIGIIALIVGSHVPALYYGFSCKPTLRVVYLSIVSSVTMKRNHIDIRVDKV